MWTRMGKEKILKITHNTKDILQMKPVTVLLNTECTHKANYSEIRLAIIIIIIQLTIYYILYTKPQ